MANKVGVGKIVKDIAGGAINKTFSRLMGAGIKGDSKITQAIAKWTGRHDDKDWRVRLTIPSGSHLYSSLFPPESYYKTSFPTPQIDGSGGTTLANRLYPLKSIGGFFWPLTPSMVIQHSANYNALAQTHSNYPFQAYQNSQVDQMNIMGEFPGQNQQDAAYWVATVNFLRTVTKMFFGKEQEYKGNPPPILHLSGYGDHMFEKVPVIVNTFNVELRAGIDYISTKQNNPMLSPEERSAFDPINPDQTWAPTLSNISVLITPVYSRETLKTFSLVDFAAGRLTGANRSRSPIGFI